jgi:hypothetical protein
MMSLPEWVVNAPLIAIPIEVLIAIVIVAVIGVLMRP